MGRRQVVGSQGLYHGLDLNLRRFSPEKVARNFICWSFATSYVPLQMRKCGHRIFIPGLVFSSIVNLHNSNWSRWSYQGTISLPTKSPPNRTRKVIVPPVMAKSCRSFTKCLSKNRFPGEISDLPSVIFKNKIDRPVKHIEHVYLWIWCRYIIDIYVYIYIIDTCYSVNMMYILIYAYIYIEIHVIYFFILIYMHTHTRFYYMYLSIYLLSTWSICISFLHTHIYHIEHTHTHIYFQCIYTHALCIRSVYTHYTLYSMQTVPYVQYIYYTHTLSIPYIVYIVSLLYINYSNIFRLPTTYTVHYTLHILCLCICATSSYMYSIYLLCKWLHTLPRIFWISWRIDT